MADSTTASRPENRRPLSPHLEIYRWTMTMAMSILHRATGAALYAGTILLAWWLIALSMNSSAYAIANAFLSSILGRIILLGFTWSLFHHLLGGLRHFIWEAGHGMEAPQRDYLATATLIGGIALTLIVWALAYAVR